MAREIPTTDIGFDEETHEYTVNGQVRPGVTGIIHGAGLSEGRFWNDESRDRGTKVSIATELYDKGVDFDMDKLGDARPFVEAWIDFRETTREVFLISLIEQRLTHEQFGYCGTCDRILWHIAHKCVDQPGDCPGHVGEIKAGVKCDWHHIQTAGYQEAAHSMGIVRAHKGITRYVIYLTADGKWTTRRTNNDEDYQTFNAALRLQNWRRIHGLTAE